jgi:uncharacterized phage protein (TIGR01671 family)
MIEIKFRAWLTVQKRMVDVDFLDIVRKRVAFTLLNEKFEGEGGFVKWEEASLMQYTGLKDKKGTPIYEGDILNIEGELFDVSYLNHAFEIFPLTDSAANRHNELDEYWIAGTPHDKHTGVEVIGNVWENPKLLRQYLALKELWKR